MRTSATKGRLEAMARDLRAITKEPSSPKVGELRMAVLDRARTLREELDDHIDSWFPDGDLEESAAKRARKACILIESRDGEWRHLSAVEDAIAAM